MANKLAALTFLLGKVASANPRQAVASNVISACANAIYAQYPDAELDVSSANLNSSFVTISDVYMKQGRRPYKYRYAPYGLYPWSCAVDGGGRIIQIFRPTDADMN